MTRDDFIEMLVKLARIRYDLSTTELNEFRTVLQMMPDREPQIIVSTPDPQPYTAPKPYEPWPHPFDNFPVAYGPPTDWQKRSTDIDEEIIRKWNTSSTLPEINQNSVNTLKDLIKDKDK